MRLQNTKKNMGGLTGVFRGVMMSCSAERAQQVEVCCLVVCRVGCVAALVINVPVCISSVHQLPVTVTPAGTSTSLTSRINGMTTHTHNTLPVTLLLFSFSFSFTSLIADEPQRCHPASGH